MDVFPFREETQRHKHTRDHYETAVRSKHFPSNIFASSDDCCHDVRLSGEADVCWRVGGGPSFIFKLFARLCSPLTLAEGNSPHPKWHELSIDDGNHQVLHRRHEG